MNSLGELRKHPDFNGMCQALGWYAANALPEAYSADGKKWRVTPYPPGRAGATEFRPLASINCGDFQVFTIFEQGKPSSRKHLMVIEIHTAFIPNSLAFFDPAFTYSPAPRQPGMVEVETRWTVNDTQIGATFGKKRTTKKTTTFQFTAYGLESVINDPEKEFGVLRDTLIAHAYDLNKWLMRRPFKAGSALVHDAELAELVIDEALLWEDGYYDEDWDDWDNWEEDDAS